MRLEFRQGKTSPSLLLRLLPSSTHPPSFLRSSLSLHLPAWPISISNPLHHVSTHEKSPHLGVMGRSSHQHLYLRLEPPGLCCLYSASHSSCGALFWWPEQAMEAKHRKENLGPCYSILSSKACFFLLPQKTPSCLSHTCALWAEASTLRIQSSTPSAMTAPETLPLHPQTVGFSLPTWLTLWVIWIPGLCLPQMASLGQRTFSESSPAWSNQSSSVPEPLSIKTLSVMSVYSGPESTPIPQIVI